LNHNRILKNGILRLTAQNDITTPPLDPASIFESKYWIPGRATLARNEKTGVFTAYYGFINNHAYEIITEQVELHGVIRYIRHSRNEAFPTRETKPADQPNRTLFPSKRSRTMKKASLTILFSYVLAVFVLAALIPPLTRAENNGPIAVTLKATPQLYQDTCPAVIKFQGEISARNLKPGTVVEYRFVRSDGAAAPIRKTVFAGGRGTIEVGTTWTLESPDLVNYEGWEMIRITKPIQVESNKASFKVNCRSAE